MTANCYFIFSTLALFSHSLCWFQLLCQPGWECAESDAHSRSLSSMIVLKVHSLVLSTTNPAKCCQHTPIFFYCVFCFSFFVCFCFCFWFFFWTIWLLIIWYSTNVGVLKCVDFCWLLSCMSWALHLVTPVVTSLDTFQEKCTHWWPDKQAVVRSWCTGTLSVSQ